LATATTTLTTLTATTAGHTKAIFFSEKKKLGPNLRSFCLIYFFRLRIQQQMIGQDDKGFN
jgi:hypothetical protein